MTKREEKIQELNNKTFEFKKEIKYYKDGDEDWGEEIESRLQWIDLNKKLIKRLKKMTDEEYEIFRKNKEIREIRDELRNDETEMNRIQVERETETKVLKDFKEKIIPEQEHKVEMLYVTLCELQDHAEWLGDKLEELTGERE